MIIGRYWFHRKEQWDLKCNPILCIHEHVPNRSTRIFCIWFWGIQLGRSRKY